MQVVFKSADGREFDSALDCLEHESKPPVHLLSQITQMKRQTLPGLHKSYMDARSAYRGIDSSFHHSEVSVLLHRLKVTREALEVGIAMYRSLRDQLKSFNSARSANPLLARMHREVQLALARNKHDDIYGGLCYESALGAYAAALQDNHSGYSWSITRNIIDRMMGDLTLVPIHDEDFVCELGDGTVTTPRQTGIFKCLSHDGEISYTDLNRVVGVDLDSGGCFSSSLCRNVVDELFPIQMPYYTSATPYKVFVRSFCDKGFPNDDHDFNREWVSHIITPHGERHEVDRTWVHKPGILLEITGTDELSERRRRDD